MVEVMERIAWPSHAPTERPSYSRVRYIERATIEFLNPLSEEQVLTLARETRDHDAYWLHELVLWACHLREGDKNLLAITLLNNPILTPSQASLLVNSIGSAVVIEAFIGTDNFRTVENWHRFLPHSLWSGTADGFHARNATESIWRNAMGKIFTTKSVRVKDAYAAHTSLRESIVRTFSRGSHRERLSMGEHNPYLSGEEALWFINPPSHVWFRAGESEIDLRKAIARNPDVGDWFVGDGEDYTDIERVLADDDEMAVRRTLWRNPSIGPSVREHLNMEFGTTDAAAAAIFAQ